MGEERETAVDAKPSGRKATRADAPHVPKRGKRTIVLDDKTWERLAVAAIKEDTTRSAIVKRLVNAACSRWVVQDRGGRPGAANLAEGENCPVETLPDGEFLTPEGDQAGSGEGEGRETPHSRLGRRRRIQSEP